MMDLRKGWILNLYSMLFINFDSFLESFAKECAECENECALLMTINECYCQRTVFYHTDRRWDGWRGRYTEVAAGVSHAYVDCFNFVISEGFLLSGSTCPENPCQHITFFHSNISTVPFNFFKKASHLVEIYLNSSGVQNLQVGAFTGLNDLQILQLESNQLSKIKAGCLTTLSTLKTLDFHNNKLKTIDDDAFIGLISLKYLDLSKNQLTSLAHQLLNPLVNLMYLILSHNFISVLNFSIEKLNKLESLYLNHNSIETIEECISYSNVNSLYLQNNVISSLKQSCFPYAVSNLNLAYNYLSSLDFFGDLKSLRTLNLSNNQINKIPIDAFEKLSNLLKLDLSQNDIHQCKTGIFSAVKNIEYLNLSRTNLNDTGPHVFIPLNNLKILDISYNNLNHWNEDWLIHFDHCEKVFLGGNSFSCEDVSSMFKQSKMKNFSLVYEANYTVENINGLPCAYIEAMSKSTILTTTDSFVSNWKNSRTQINNLSETLEKFLLHHSATGQTKLENLKENIKSSLKSLNNSIKFEFLSFNKTLYEYLNMMGNNMSKGDQSLEYEKSITKNEHPFLNNSIIINMEKKIASSLSQLRFFIVMGFLSFACLSAIVKIITCCLATRRINSFEMGQELTFLSR
ncbi:toll-like receptor 13 [Harmonia axyridis]|uniref:toll-like receptor 13 n=1 Tax=Harmonia axyridis TaxID=115357 RepID=UPI001E27623D|nr:toll-like receptor 13 [Harmonia axyridis]